MNKSGVFLYAGAVLLFLAFMPLTVSSEQGHMHGQTAPAEKGGAEISSDLVTDPVCGMRIKPEEAAAKAEYQGKTYYFCMAAEKVTFEKDPEKYLAQIKEPEAPKAGTEEHHQMEGHEQVGHEHKQEMKHEQHGEHWMAPDQEAKKPNPVKSTPEALAASREIFSEKCSICHGQGGKGDGALADSLSPRPGDLTGELTRSHSDGDLFYKISKGKGAMPGWEMLFTEEQRWSLVNYIRALSL